MLKSKRTTSKQIRQNLFDKRINAGMSQQQMADLLGCSKPYYNGIENAREMPSDTMWLMIESLFRLGEVDNSNIRTVSEIPTLKPNKKVHKKKTVVKSDASAENGSLADDADDYDGISIHPSNNDTPNLLDKNDLKRAKH